MNENELKNLLAAVHSGDLSIEEGIERLRALPFEDVGVALIDHHRELRQGVPEVILAENKSADQLAAIVQSMADGGRNILATRLSPDKADTLLKRYPNGQYDGDGRIFTLVQSPVETVGQGKIVVACAGTSDIPVVREAAITAKMLGNPVEELIDVGVAGIHRLLARAERLRDAAVIIVVAGMEGALPSVVGGMVAVPVIAVPTSTGYGTAFSGVTALLGMLNSCAAGVTVVNIDNGFGAAFAATRINRLGTR